MTRQPDLTFYVTEAQLDEAIYDFAVDLFLIVQTAIRGDYGPAAQQLAKSVVLHPSHLINHIATLDMLTAIEMSATSSATSSLNSAGVADEVANTLVYDAACRIKNAIRLVSKSPTSSGDLGGMTRSREEVGFRITEVTFPTTKN